VRTHITMPIHWLQHFLHPASPLPSPFDGILQFPTPIIIRAPAFLMGRMLATCSDVISEPDNSCSYTYHWERTRNLRGSCERGANEGSRFKVRSTLDTAGNALAIFSESTLASFSSQARPARVVMQMRRVVCRRSFYRSRAEAVWLCLLMARCDVRFDNTVEPNDERQFKTFPAPAPQQMRYATLALYGAAWLCFDGPHGAWALAGGEGLMPTWGY
jgi:hypothetical protein